MIERITFNTEENKLIINFEGGTTKEYTQADKDQYLSDNPDRGADLIAMGWVEAAEVIAAYQASE